MRIDQSLRQWRAQGLGAWRALAPRERRALGLVAAVLAVTLLWLLFIEPPLVRIAHWQAETSKLRSQARALDELLAQVPRAVTASEGPLALQQSLEHAQLHTYVQLQQVPDGWQLTWHQAPADTALAWMLQGPARQGLSVAEAQLQRDPLSSPEAPATLSGTFRLHHALGAKDSP
ncbi:MULTISPECIES: type II secretion system protein GspM [Pseudomonas]|uniref:type II secretion system protein GspM n=1 Tax=Pseudomonas TaxID=286 RepID=UPI001E5C43F9|nr:MULTISPECIES: type II secretion system protein GspM [Pseudomonas]MCE1117224.1 type II secretion system protein M [Pseudomonas sp. NMI795_08]